MIVGVVFCGFASEIFCSFICDNYGDLGGLRNSSKGFDQFLDGGFHPAGNVHDNDYS